MRSPILKSLLLSLTIAALSLLASNQLLAQTQPLTRTSHLNDFAAVVDEATGVRLENILENLQRKTGVQFDVATVKTLSGQDIFEFSKALARDWNVGARTSPHKSLLLVIAVDEKTAFTQFSKSVQPDLPEGSLGEMGQRMRVLLTEGQFSLAVRSAIEYFVGALGDKMAFTLEELDRPVPSVTEAATTAAPVIQTEPSRSTSETPVATQPTDAVPKRQSKPLRKTAARNGPTTTKEVAAIESVSTSADDDDESEEVELTLTVPLLERVTKLKEFLATHPKSKSRPRAFELLVSSHAALGDAQLKAGDSVGGIEQLMLAIDEAPADVSEKLFSGVIAQIPMNLYLRNQTAAAFKAAQNIESKFGTDARHSLALASFYLGIERGDEAARLAAKALELDPNLAEAHYSLGVALHISFRLEDAITEYKRAIELDGNLLAAKRSLADLERATGRAEDALSFYRERVTADSKDKAARAGLVLALLDLGKTDEGNKELEAALKDDPRNVGLLAGSSYWFAAHNDSKRAFDLGKQAVDLEPRYTWSQIALSRALISEKRPLEAERAIRFARQYGKFPTLDYELATVLSSLGLYEEASEPLTQSFTIRGDEIETKLGGRTEAKASNFMDLLAPERRASLFQQTAADSTDNARTLKALLAFTVALDQVSKSEEGAETALMAAGKDFVAGNDPMRTYRDLYIASRLVRAGKGLDFARDLLSAARTNANEALEVPAVTVAVQADELRAIRSRAIAAGSTPDIPEAPRNALGNILRGRIEDLTGWILFNQDKPAEAIEYLQRAANVLPENTPAWRSALWHLGASLEQTGKNDEALTNYIKSYNAGDPDPVRHSMIEKLYVKMNGSTAGLDERLGATPAESNITSSPAGSVSSPTSDVPVVNKNADNSTAAKPEATATVPAPTPTEATSPSAPGTPEPTPSPAATTTPADAPTTKDEDKPAEKVSTPADAAAQPAPSNTSATSDLPVVPATLTVSGQVKDSEGNPLSNVVVVLISPRGTVLASTTDSAGVFLFTVSPSEKPFRLLPSKEGFSFDPIDKSIVAFTENQKGISFVGKQKQ